MKTLEKPEMATQAVKEAEEEKKNIGEEVWEASSPLCQKEGQKRELKKESKMQTRSKELLLGLGLGEEKHVDECAWEHWPTDQWVTLQKKSTAGI